MRNLKWLAGMIFLLSLRGIYAQGVSPFPPTKPDKYYHNMHVRTLYQNMIRHKPMLIMDVRSAYAFKMEHIQGAESWPLSDVKSRIAYHPPPRNIPIIAYCSCPRHESQMLYDLLQNSGYTNMYVLWEGLPGWKKLNYPTVGSLSHEPLTIYWAVGYVRGEGGKPLSGVQVRFFHPKTQQLEIGTTGRDGFYALKLYFHGLLPGDQMQAALGHDVIFFTVGNKTKPWGTEVDDDNAHVQTMPNSFLKAFKKHKLRP